MCLLFVTVQHENMKRDKNALYTLAIHVALTFVLFFHTLLRSRDPSHSPILRFSPSSISLYYYLVFPLFHFPNHRLPFFQSFFHLYRLLSNYPTHHLSLFHCQTPLLLLSFLLSYRPIIHSPSLPLSLFLSPIRTPTFTLSHCHMLLISLSPSFILPFSHVSSFPVITITTACKLHKFQRNASRGSQ